MGLAEDVNEQFDKILQRRDAWRDISFEFLTWYVKEQPHQSRLMQMALTVIQEIHNELKVPIANIDPVDDQKVIEATPVTNTPPIALKAKPVKIEPAKTCGECGSVIPPDKQGPRRRYCLPCAIARNKRQIKESQECQKAKKQAGSKTPPPVKRATHNQVTPHEWTGKEVTISGPDPVQYDPETMRALPLSERLRAAKIAYHAHLAANNPVTQEFEASLISDFDFKRYEVVTLRDEVLNERSGTIVRKCIECQGEFVVGIPSSTRKTCDECKALQRGARAETAREDKAAAKNGTAAGASV